MSQGKQKLAVMPLGLAIGLLWGLSVLVTGLITTLHGGWGVDFVTAMGSMYIGYDNTIAGSVIGGIWGFVDGFIGGALIALFYNWFCCCCKKSCHKDSACDKDKSCQ
jgi:hypothetical protein